MSASTKIIYSAIFWAIASQPVYAAFPWDESFNSVSTIVRSNGGSPAGSDVLGGGSVGTPNGVDGVAEIPNYSTTNFFGGTLTTNGSASYDALKIFVEIDGPIADHQGTAFSHQILNVSDPTISPGTSGTLYLSYSYNGSASFVAGVGNAVEYHFWVKQNVENTGIGGTLLYEDLGSIGAGSAVANVSNGTNIAVPFIYGEDFRITTSLSVRTLSDRNFTFAGGNWVLASPSSYESITAAFDESAVLNAIYLPDGASISLASASGYDLSPFVRFGQPVPIPASIALFAPALLLFRARRQ